jgi:hypothetical protein
MAREFEDQRDRKYRNANFPFVSGRSLWRVFPEHGEGILAVVVNRAGNQYPCAPQHIMSALTQEES